MSVFRLTETSTDLYRPASATSFERVRDAVQGAQHLRTRLRLFEGEVFRDTRIGIQFFSLVTVIGVPPTAIANHFASVALDTPGITECDISFEFESVRGVIEITADAVFLLADQRTRVPLHEVILVNSGGSIQT
jgi:hypothetical protein